MSDAWVQIIRPKPAAKARLFCFPYAGGGASIYRTWGDFFSRDLEIVAVQLPGREGRVREPAIASLSELLPQLAEALRPRMNVPFAFFGHSMGALVSFELARYLRKNGGPLPDQLLISARPAPHLPHRHTPIHGLPEADFIWMVGERYQAIPPQVLKEPAIMKLVVPTLRADLQLVETHVFQEEEPLRIPIAAFGGRRDTLVPEADLRAWDRHSSNYFTCNICDGDHFYLNDERYRPGLLHGLWQQVSPLIHPQGA